jgi:glycosyltransferase involved in cell wall biosynthesis
MNSNDVLLHPTLKEAFGRIFIEAMGKGVPVVAVASGGAKELIRHGRTGFLVEANEQGKAADYIMELLYDEDTYKRMQQEAFRYAAENFSIEQTGRDLLHMYRNLIENKGSCFGSLIYASEPKHHYTLRRQHQLFKPAR